MGAVEEKKVMEYIETRKGDEDPGQVQTQRAPEPRVGLAAGGPSGRLKS